MRIRVATLCLVTLVGTVATAEEQPKRRAPSVTVLVNGTDIVDLSKADPATAGNMQILEVDNGDDDRIDEGLEQLERFPGLKSLLIACPKLTDKGLRHIAKLKRLECLVIYQCEISDEGLQELKALSKLRIVGLHNTPVTDAGVAKLKRALKSTDFELSAFGKHGSVFDANGCIRPKFLKRYFSRWEDPDE